MNKGTTLANDLRAWFEDAPPSDAPEAFDRLVDTWGVRPVCEALLRGYHDKTAELADRVRGAKALRVMPRPVKTVGTFFSRMKTGGTERVLSVLIRLWIEQGYRVVLVTDQAPDARDYPLPPEVRRRFLTSSYSVREGDWLERFFGLQLIFREEHVDVFVHHDWPSDVLLWDVLAVKLTGIPLVQYMHSVFSGLLRNGNFSDVQAVIRMTHVYRLMDAVVTLSRTDQSFWRAFCPNTRLFSNPCALRAPDCQPAPLTSHDILWVGRISPEKRLIDAVEALAVVVRTFPEAHLIVLGEAEPCFKGTEDAVFQRVRALGLEDSVRFEGFEQDVAPYYHNAAVYLCTSVYEGYSLTIAESKCFGLPCVMYDMPYLGFVEDGRGIVLVPDGDARAAGEAIIRLFSDDALRGDAGRAARQSAMDFDNERIKRDWRALFERFETPAPLSDTPADA